MVRSRAGRRSLLASTLGAVGLAFVASAQSQTVVPDPRQDIRATYDFEPATMTFDEQARRAPALSALWSRYDQNRDAYRDALRTELRATGNRELLYCDGGMLLLAKSSEPDDRALGLSAIEKCSLAEIQHTPYFYTLHMLAVEGVDTFELQARILTKPTYSAFIVQHALSLGQDYAFLYPFLVQDEKRYVPALVARLRIEADPVAQKSIIRALWYAATADAEAAVRGAAADQRLSSDARAHASKLLEGVDAVRGWRSDAPALQRIYGLIRAKPTSREAELRDKRRARMRSISDEALYDLDAYTALIYRTRRAR